MAKHDERLTEALVDLGALQGGETLSLSESGAILNCLTAINSAERFDAALTNLLQAICEAMDCEMALAIAARHGGAFVKASTRQSLIGVPFSDNILARTTPTRFKDTRKLGWWSLVPPEVYVMRSGLSAPMVVGEDAPVIVLALRAPPAAFALAEKALLGRLTAVASQVLRTRAAAERNQLLAGVIEGSTNSVAIAAVQGDEAPLVYVNDAFSAQTGYQPSEVLGRNALVVSAEGAAGAEGERLREAVQQRTAGTFVLPNRRRDGSTFWGRLTLTPINDVNGAVTHLIATQVEVDAEPQTEGAAGPAANDRAKDAANDSVADTLTAAVDQAQDGIAIINESGRFAYLNAAHVKMFGYDSLDELLGQSWAVLYDKTAAEFIERVGMAALKEAGSWRSEVVGRTREGKPVSQEVSLTMLDGIGLVCVTRDVSDRYRNEHEQAKLRERLAVSQRQEAIGQLAAGVAHDFNNLLSVITASASMVADEVPANQSAQKHLARILSAGMRAGQLVGKLIESERMDEPDQTIDGNEAMREAADLLRAGVPPRFVVSLDLPDETVTFNGDPGDLLQAVLNLAINARDAMGENAGEIRLSLRRSFVTAPPVCVLGDVSSETAYAVISVKDSGAGIPETLQEEIFKPYFTTKGNEGTGLGLAIVASVISKVDGGLTLWSRVGMGTTFTIYWPVEARESDLPERLPLDGARSTAAILEAHKRRAQRDPNSPEADKAEAAFSLEALPPLTGRQQVLRGMTVLVCDDSEEVAETIAAILDNAGAETAVCIDPRDALTAIQEDPDDWALLITDFDMPHMKGSELAASARETRRDLPILLITAMDRYDRELKLFDAVLKKPIDAHRLLDLSVQCIETALWRWSKTPGEDSYR